MIRRVICGLLFLWLIGGCTTTTASEGEIEMTLKLTSMEFKHGGAIPAKYTCKGEDVSPPLAWETPPDGTQSFVLIMDDPDAPVGTWDHWLLYNLPADLRSLPEAISADPELTDGSRHGKNSWGRMDYGGPCPPSGTHHYSFRLYALDTRLDLQPGAPKKQLLNLMQGHILAQGELMGTFKK